ncbi:MAG: hypothetical protein ABSB94_16670 [Syntrophorhabdales bacterium]
MLYSLARVDIKSLPWERMKRLVDRWLPLARVCHPYPLVRFSVTT